LSFSSTFFRLISPPACRLVGPSHRPNLVLKYGFFGFCPNYVGRLFLVLYFESFPTPLFQSPRRHVLFYQTWTFLPYPPHRQSWASPCDFLLLVAFCVTFVLFDFFLPCVCNIGPSRRSSDFSPPSFLGTFSFSSTFLFTCKRLFTLPTDVATAIFPSLFHHTFLVFSFFAPPPSPRSWNSSLKKSYAVHCGLLSPASPVRNCFFFLLLPVAHLQTPSRMWTRPPPLYPSSPPPPPPPRPPFRFFWFLFPQVGQVCLPLYQALLILTFTFPQ